jgi:hypothetical protein
MELNRIALASLLLAPILALNSCESAAARAALPGHLIGHADEHGNYDGRPLPYARPVDRGVVESPYRPNNRINVEKFPRGSVVEDPTTGRYFIRP